MSVGEPAATTVKVAAWPAVTVWLTGCVVIVGAVALPEPPEPPEPLEPLPVPPVLPFVVVWTTPLQPTAKANASASAAQNWPVEAAREHFVGKGDAIFIF